MEEAEAKLREQQKAKEQTNKELEKKDLEIQEYEKQLKENKLKYEKEQLKMLTYRKEDILDLLQSLKNMPNANNLKKKTESLENELLKIDSELFELEKKYGEFKIRKSYVSEEEKEEQVQKSSSSNAEE